MARPKNTLPTIHQHKNGQFFIRIQGVQHYLGRDLREAERRRAKLLRDEGLLDALPLAADLVVAEALEVFVREELPRRANRNRYLRGIDAALSTCGEMHVEQFRSKALLDVRAWLLADITRGRVRGKPLSRGFVNQVIGCVVSAWQWLVMRELVPAETLEYLRAVRGLGEGEGGAELDVITPPPPGAVEQTLPFLSSVVADMVRVQSLLGVRPGELCRMRRCEISTAEEERIALPKTKLTVSAFSVDGIVIWVYVPSSHKTLRKGKPRAVVVGPRAQAILGPRIAGLKPERWIFGGEREVATFGVAPYSPHSYRREVVRAIAQAKRKGIEIPHWHPNQLRHLTATEVGEQFDRESAAAVLGHAGMDVVDIYAMQALKKAGQVAAAMG